MQFEIAEIRGQVDDLFALDEPLVLAAVGDEVFDGGDFEVVLNRKLHQVGEAGHGAVVVHDFAADASRLEPGETREIDGCFRVAAALQDAAWLGLEREDVARLNEVLRSGIGIDQHADDSGAVGGTDTGGDAVGGIDGDGEGGFLALAVLQDHALKAELLSPLVGNGGTNEPTRMHHHEVNGFGGDFFGGHDEITLIFPARVIGDNDHLTLADIRQHCFNCVKLLVHRTIIHNPERWRLPEKKTMSLGRNTFIISSTVSSRPIRERHSQWRNSNFFHPEAFPHRKTLRLLHG